MKKILVIGGTRFAGIPMVEQLIRNGYDVTIATRGIKKDSFGSYVKRVILDITDEASIKKALYGLEYHIVIDKMGYCSNEVRNILDNVKCDRFIHMSTAGVYNLDHFDIREEEFNGNDIKLLWCNRRDFVYDDVKRQAEAVLYQKYKDLDWASVRCPIIMGKNDYTNRLFFYVDHIVNQKPMHINNINCQLGFANVDEVGRFLAFLVEKSNVGAINACSLETISVFEIIKYVEEKSGVASIVEESGEEAPYNNLKDYSLSVEKAYKLGFEFRNIHEWITDLLDYYIDYAKRMKVQ